jgi:hypothetical protein
VESRYSRVYAQFIWDKYSSIWTEYSDFFNATAATLQILQILIYSKNQTAPKSREQRRDDIGIYTGRRRS